MTDRTVPRPSFRSLAIAGGVLAAVAAAGVGVAVAAPAGSHNATVAAYGYSSYGAAPSGKPTTRPAMTPHLFGTVTSTSSGVILIKDPEGFTRTIKVSSSTKYGTGVSATVAKGTTIIAAGKVDTDGTSLDATTVDKATDHPGGPGGFGPGRGGFGGHGRPDGPRPSTSGTRAATPSPTTSAC